MPKLVYAVPLAKLVSIRKLCPDESSDQNPWDSRLPYLNFEGALYIFESLHEAPGRHAALIIRQEAETCAWFHTSHGEYQQKGNRIHVKTRNSDYVFEILDDTITEENTEKLNAYLALYKLVIENEK